jgi:hypothetical protein
MAMSVSQILKTTTEYHNLDLHHRLKKFLCHSPALKPNAVARRPSPSRPSIRGSKYDLSAESDIFEMQLFNYLYSIYFK